jgi:demethoxyubiquinone hydroxylase (CLK1/Coq7/Cat5 family)
MKPDSFRSQTITLIQDLHARELMRLGWYRQWQNNPRLNALRERKAHHQAFLNDLLRRREVSPVWYARYFYLLGHLFGWCTAFLPRTWAQRIESTLEFWILMRYERYFRRLELKFSMRSMVEALQMNRLTHPDPGPEVLNLIQEFIHQQRTLLDSAQVPPQIRA